MNTALKRFIAKTVVISAGIALVGWLVFTLLIPQYYLPVFPLALIFFLIVTILVHAYQLKLAKTNMAKFTRSTMLVTFFKLVIYSVFAAVYIATNAENAIPFVIGLMLLYLVFSFVEVTEITKITK
jgi:MFS superfamily sulfate permease-like transporter